MCKDVELRKTEKVSSVKLTKDSRTVMMQPWEQMDVWIKWFSFMLAVMAPFNKFLVSLYLNVTTDVIVQEN